MMKLMFRIFFLSVLAVVVSVAVSVAVFFNNTDDFNKTNYWYFIRENLFGIVNLTENYALVSTDGSNYSIAYRVKKSQPRNNEPRNNEPGNESVKSWLIAYLVTEKHIYALYMKTNYPPASKAFEQNNEPIECIHHRILLSNDTNKTLTKKEWITSITEENYIVTEDLINLRSHEDYQTCYESLK